MFEAATDWEFFKGEGSRDEVFAGCWASWIPQTLNRERVFAGIMGDYVGVWKCGFWS